MSSFVQFGSGDPSNLKVGVGKTYTFNFDNQSAFDNFNFINYGSHIVDKSFPTITLTISPFGPLNFGYTTEHKVGSLDVSEDCLDCNNSQYEVFLSNDTITESNVEKYVKNCGASEFSTSNFNIKVLNDYGNGYKNYLISYCCDLDSGVALEYCAVRWDLNVSVNCESKSLFGIPAEGIASSAPKMECSSSTSTFNSWHCASDSQKISYFAKGDFCHKGCTSDDVDGALLIQPQLPTHTELIDILSVEPTPTPTPAVSSPLSSLTPIPIPLADVANLIYPTPTGTIYIDDPSLDLNTAFLDSISLVSQELAGDKPHSPNYCHFVGHSKVLTKVNDGDLPDRVFYKETDDGYFYKRKTSVHKGTNEASTDINGGTVLLLDEPDSEKPLLPKDMFTGGARTLFFNGGDLAKSSYFISLIDYTSPAPTPIPQQSQLVEDQSLFERIYHFDSFEVQSEVSTISSGTNLLHLNWSYWLYSLPEKIYGKQIWWEGLSQEHLPYFEIIKNPSNLYYNTYSFSNNSSKVYFSHTNNNPNIESFSFIKTDSNAVDNYREDYLDPVFNIEHGVYSHQYPIKLKYYFNPNQSLISSEYQQFNLPIERVEELSFFPNSSSIHLDSRSQFGSNYAVDKTLGVINPKNALIQGKGIRFF
jgi:hypothetical protein